MKSIDVWKKYAVACAEKDGTIVVEDDGYVVGGYGKVGEIVVVDKPIVRLCSTDRYKPKIGFLFPPGEYVVHDGPCSVYSRGYVYNVYDRFVSKYIFVYVWEGGKRKIIRIDEGSVNAYAKVISCDKVRDGIVMKVYSNAPANFVVECNGEIVHDCVSYGNNEIYVKKVCDRYKVSVRNGWGDKVWELRVVGKGTITVSLGCVRV